MRSWIYLGATLVAVLGVGVFIGQNINDPVLGKQPEDNAMAAAESAYAAKDYEAVLENLRPLAAAGDSLAQHRLGLMYSQGLGVEPDVDIAIDWLVRASAGGVDAARPLLASQYVLKSQASSERKVEVKWLDHARELGSSEALAVLGSYYLAGVGVEKNVALALEMLEAAAKAGDARAMTNLGYMYATGTGVTQNYETALQRYLAAAEAGLPRAQSAAGSLYERGLGTEKDLAEAGKWYVRAAVAGDLNAASRLGSLVARDVVRAPDDETSVRVVAVAAASGDVAARDWLEDRSEQNDSSAQSALAQLLLGTGGEESDTARGIALLKSAAKSNNRIAQRVLAEHFSAGILMEQDFVEAHRWANLAAISGDPQALSLRDSLTQLMTPDQVAAAQRLARREVSPQN